MTTRALVIAVHTIFTVHAGIGHAQTVHYVDHANCPGPGAGTPVDPFCRIQDAITSSSDGDEIVVLPGTYFEDIDYLGKPVTLRSSDPTDPATIEATVIHGGPGSVVVFRHQESHDSVLDGVTVTGGTGTPLGPNAVRTGGGILCMLNSSPTIRNCIIAGNTHGIHSGGGISCRQGSSPTVTHCTITGNVVRSVGGGIEISGESSPRIMYCTIAYNIALGNHLGQVGWGGGLFMDRSDPLIHHCIIFSNSANRGGGLAINFSNPLMTNCSVVGNDAVQRGGGLSTWSSGRTSTPEIRNCILWNNTAPPAEGASLLVWGPDNFPSVDFSNVEGGFDDVLIDLDASLDWGMGNINFDPLFMEVEADNYRLRHGSPCIDAGDNIAVPEETGVDLDGNPRFIDDPATPDTGNPDGINPLVDMGAYEFNCVDDDGDGKIATCHKGRTIEVSVNALAAHLRHGDECGACD